MEKKNYLPVIKERISVRRYSKNEIEPDLLTKIRSWGEEVSVLDRNNTYKIEIIKPDTQSDLVKALGGYGRVTNPPAYLVPSIIGERQLLADCGYRTQQLVIRLYAEGLGACYLGSITRQEIARQLFGLPDGASIGAFLIFGHPAEDLGGQAVNSFMHHITGANRKLAAEEIFFYQSFSRPQKPPQELDDIITAARLSPSAVNAQPWRFLWSEKNLYLYIKNFNQKYAKGEAQNYRYYDGGICMGNISMALASKNISFSWQLIERNKQLFPSCPQNLEPLAKLVMG